MFAVSSKENPSACIAGAVDSRIPVSESKERPVFWLTEKR